MCNGVLDQDPESFLNSLSKKFNPPPPPQDDGTGAGSVINAVLTLMPEDDDDDEERMKKHLILKMKQSRLVQKFNASEPTICT